MCAAGHPRWLAIPFLREFIVTPDQTWLSSETVNNVRRIYTDGRDHIPEVDRYPLYYGDSIGFWNDSTLTIHTNQLRAGIYQRGNLGKSSRDRRDLGEGRRSYCRSRRVGLRSPGARRAVVKSSSGTRRSPTTTRSCGSDTGTVSRIPTTRSTRLRTGAQFKDFTFTESDNRKNE